ncbi:MAG: hypothetical protein AAGJ87_01470 [Pseudomonadota bacterium]
MSGVSNYAFEAAVVSFIVSVFVLYAYANLRDRHRDEAKWHIGVGAAVYGFIIGLVIAFVILPMRTVLINGETPPEMAAVSGVGVFLVMFSLRRGLVGRLPFLGAQLKAYRRAQLRKTIESASRELGRLEAKNGDTEAATDRRRARRPT